MVSGYSKGGAHRYGGSSKAFELVLRGHPDKVCDIVSKEICDANEGGRNAIECMWGNHLFVVSGETDKQWQTDQLTSLVHSTLLVQIGLTQEEVDSVQVVNNLNVQSAEINEVVGQSGTGDNGIYFGGYHRFYSPAIEKMKEMCDALTACTLAEWGYRTDGKFIFYVDSHGHVDALTINIASFEGRETNPYALISFIHTFTGAECLVSVNPKGEWHKCFGFADCGLTGRKLACDGSCGLFSHGGGAMFGKDISKADVTVPIYLNHLAKTHVTGHKKVSKFSASSIIGDRVLDVYQDEEFYGRISFNTMKEFVSSGYLDVFGVFKK